MIRRWLRIGRWKVCFLFAEAGYDIGEVLDAVRACGASREFVGKARELMEDCGLDCGFTFSNPTRKRAVVFVGPTSSGEEFVDSFVHEVHHLAVAIASELGIDLESESPAYLAGDSARALADVVCRLGCQRCRCN